MRWTWIIDGRKTVLLMSKSSRCDSNEKFTKVIVVPGEILETSGY